MRYIPTQCPKCGNEQIPKPQGGRPTRWCSDGCRRSGEAEMARLDSLLRAFTEGKYVEMLNNRLDNRREQAIKEMQVRYDHLAGVPKQELYKAPG